MQTNYNKQNVPDNIKSKKLLFSSLNVNEEVKGYLDIDTDMNDQVKDLLREFYNKKHDEMPVCVLSHMFDEKRSKFLVNMKAESELRDLDRKYLIFTYEDQKELYSQFNEIKNVEVIYISLDNPIYLTLSGKRQYILEYCQSNNYDNAFFIEDDCFDFILPVGALGESGSFRNKRYVMSFNFTFSFWEFLVDKFQLTYSGPVNNMEFAFRDLTQNNFIKQNGQVVQSVHINTKLCKEKNINFDHDAGWDDYDMIIQQCCYNKGTQAVIFSYNTPSLKSGVSAMSKDANSLKIRCEKNTTALISKWGLSLVREDTKKGLYNAKVNWFTMKRALKQNVPLTKIIKMGNDEAKNFIDSYCEEQSNDW